jgi:hypothetical protein
MKTKGTAEERHVDSWLKDGKDGRWTRAHRTARKSLFTPYKVAGGPSAKTPLKRLRVTRGKYLDSGRTFKIIDDWTVRANAHRVLASTWLGTTDFRESAEFIDDDSDEEVDENIGNEDDKEPEIEHYELSPARSRTTSSHPEELLSLKLEAEGKSDLGRLALLEARGQPLASSGDDHCPLIPPSAPLRRHGSEGECRNPVGVIAPAHLSHNFVLADSEGLRGVSRQTDTPLAPLARIKTAGERSVARSAPPLPPNSPL